MDKITFERLINTSLENLPEKFLRKMENIIIVVEDLPSREVMLQFGVKNPRHLLGLYHGVPLRSRGVRYGNVLPDKISIYKKSIEALCRTEEEISLKVREVVMHEIGHYFGMSEEELRNAKI
ncbi:metallopeptidase family protein [bacterium]|nr:metallopeptidase family protein [bacterium]